jgi:hypothetical protein
MRVMIRAYSIPVCGALREERPMSSFPAANPSLV